MQSRLFGPVCAAGLAMWVLAGCSGKVAREDPLGTLRNENTDTATRIAGVNALWDQEGARSSGERHAAARESLKRIAWQASYPGPVRIRAMEILADDPGEQHQSDARRMFMLMLATEPNMDVIGFISRRAAQGGWTELTPALVRSYSRKTDPPPDAEREERKALLALHPGRSIEEIAFSVFTAPVSGEGAALERGRKAQLAAWELLSRLDADGSRRAALLTAAQASGDDATLGDLRACAADLRCIPLTAAQLDWLTRLRDFSDAQSGSANRAWWDEAKAAVGSLPADRLAGWTLRNVEPLRWARANRPQWVAMDRAALTSDIRSRLRGRAVAVRGDADRGGGEMFSDWIGKFTWGDLLTIAVVDEAINTPGLGVVLAEQVARDRLDITSEYGGVLQWRAEEHGGRFVPVLYPPRPSQRQSDHQFVASDQMLAEGARSLAHYHFHVQRDENRDYAGPGPGDRQYADNQGRACVVFTSIRTGIVNADYYQAGGIVVDLGEVRLK